MAMKDLQPNRDYDAYVRIMLALRHEELSGKRGEARRAVLDKWQERTRELRATLRRVGNPSDRVVIYDPNDYESCTVIYREPFEFEGTKQELHEHLWENYATRIYSPYDCTGQRFTTGYIIGSLGNNLWRIAESFGLDV